MSMLSPAAAFVLVLVLAAPNASLAASAAPTLSPATIASDDALLHAYSVAVDAQDMHLPRCGAPLEGELAITVVDVMSRVPFPSVDKQQRYYGRPEFTVSHVTVHIPRSIDWPGITARERAVAETMLAALRHHEVGHVRIAVAEVARLNAQPLTVTPDAEVYRRTVTRLKNEGLAALSNAQVEYDELTDHGRRQDRASGVLAGPPTELLCMGPAPHARTKTPDVYVAPPPQASPHR